MITLDLTFIQSDFTNKSIDSTMMMQTEIARPRRILKYIKCIKIIENNVIKVSIYIKLAWFNHLLWGFNQLWY